MEFIFNNRTQSSSMTPYSFKKYLESIALLKIKSIKSIDLFIRERDPTPYGASTMQILKLKAANALAPGLTVTWWL